MRRCRKQDEIQREKRKKTVRQQTQEKPRRRAGAYLTDNVVIVRQVVSVGLRGGRRGVAQFPYVWLRAVGCGGQGEAVRLRLAALGAVLTAAGQKKKTLVIGCVQFFINMWRKKERNKS